MQKWIPETGLQNERAIPVTVESRLIAALSAGYWRRLFKISTLGETHSITASRRAPSLGVTLNFGQLQRDFLPSITLGNWIRLEAVFEYALS